MSNNSSDEVIGKALQAAFLVLTDGKLQAKLQDDDSSREALERLGLPETARPALLNIVNRVEHLTAHTSPASKPSARSSRKEGKAKRDKREKYERMLLESFDHIRWSFWISLIMSVILFVLGMTFLSIATVRSLSESAVSTATLTIAGLGIADFVLLFYTRPWQDISVNLSNSQQVKIIATSYLVGLSFLHAGKTEETESLEQLTKGSVGLLEDFAEEHSSGSTNASETGTS